jgi:hypothetical protein
MDGTIVRRARLEKIEILESFMNCDLYHQDRWLEAWKQLTMNDLRLDSDDV